MKYRINWDNGYAAAGTFPGTYDSEQEAQIAADDILADNLADGVWDDSASVEVIEVGTCHKCETDLYPLDSDGRCRACRLYDEVTEV